MPAKDEPEWLHTERVVRLLEEAIERYGVDARVEHDVKLPDKVTGDLRQCDVVIRAKSAEGEILTIVEVQHRSRPVKILTFQGWCEKRRVLGADHLLCVAKKPYPDSIKRDVAMRRGPIVNLLRLDELEEDRWPIRVVDSRFLLTLEVRTNTPRPARFEFRGDKPERVMGLQSEKVFRRGEDKAKLSVEDLVNRELEEKEIDFGGREETDCPVAIPVDPPLYYIGIHRSYRIKRMEVPVRIRKVPVELPVRVHAYEQIGEPGSLAWAMTGEGVYKGRVVRMRVALTANLDGSFTAHSVECSGIEGMRSLDLKITTQE